MRNIKNLVQDVVVSPLGDVIASVGQGVADAQQALDEASIAKTLEIYTEGGEKALEILRAIGYKPTFYTLPETTGEVKVALRLGPKQSSSIQPAVSKTRKAAVSTALARAGLDTPALKPRMFATPVDAGYANKYGYQADVSAKLTFKIVPVPAPGGADELRVLPKLVGLKANDAEQLLDSLGLDTVYINQQGVTIDEPAASAKVLRQLPGFDEEEPVVVSAGDKIYLTVK
ncbi:PASTA domain-containing protein [Sansalvadorimonas sp. 2012CJ34-2]|uniref:PASTA domain-containing protein n=1 Tax=Parendozoicomonas callyspongiae TaxID=2942213 RepID=A0ABT0PJW1_9GAMM|nr:PASTA domain-containing protein [Sansalvadorimonas sp. 2012CJ34-2]MCL6271674.1 PASTA domain-containing protein [Sansalvadorimonas sp. 2012CJ34-2]